MQRFIQQHAGQISGVLSGFDRMRFRGTLRWLAHTQGMQWFLNSTGVLLKEFKTYVQGVTDQVRAATERLAKTAGRPLLYLDSSRISKEETARQIAERDGIQQGLICVFSAVEPCFSYEVRRDPQARKLQLRGRTQKCLHYYFYLQHPEFGFMHLRLQTWFPLTIHIAMNGREWLARQLDAAGIGYRRADNCFLDLADPVRTQELCDLQLKTRWRRCFVKLLHQYHPSHKQLFRERPVEYYWSLDQSEWATDILFRSPEALAQLYPQLLRHAAYIKRRARISQAANERYLDALAEVHATQPLGELTKASASPPNWVGGGSEPCNPGLPPTPNSWKPSADPSSCSTAFATGTCARSCTVLASLPPPRNAANRPKSAGNCACCVPMA